MSGYERDLFILKYLFVLFKQDTHFIASLGPLIISYYPVLYILDQNICKCLQEDLNKSNW